MKKLLILILTVFLSISIFLCNKEVKAEIEEITPIYSGDIFNGQNLYLFQTYSNTPNFENGYLLTKTISNLDVYYAENNAFNGWYKDLGADLIDTYTAPDNNPQNPYFTFYITFNDMLSQYFQFGLIQQRPFEANYYIKFKNESPTLFLTTGNDVNFLITPPTNDMTKQVEWMAWEVYYQDYLASFKPLTADLAYNFGFSAGELSGFDSGYNSGYNLGLNRGYENGYNQALQDTETYGVSKVVNFNQLIPNNRKSKTINANTANWVRICEIPNIDINHKYLLKWYQNTTFETNQRNTPTYIIGNNARVYQYASSDHNLLSGYYYWFITPNGSGTLNLDYWEQSTIDGVYFYFNFFDLTQIYGIGNEPTSIDDFENYFNSDDYEYTTSTLINIDYENGYRDGYVVGENDGYNTGYSNGMDYQATKQLTSTGWIQSIFRGMGSFLALQIFPGVTIGLIVGIPFIISLAYFVIRAFRGGGGA